MQIFPAESSSKQTPADFIEQLCILAYLIKARELPPTNRLVKAESLPGGTFFFRGPHVLPTNELARTFGDSPGLLFRAQATLNAKKCTYGDASIEFDVLPRLKLTLVIWGRDEEFDARGSILFDQTAAEQMPLDALQAAVNMAVQAVMECSIKAV
jgi:hypothetical protein